MVKRLLDVVGGAVGLLGLAIPFLVIAILIKLDSIGPVFFRQERAGRDGEPFEILKFRSMTTEAPSEGFGHSVTEDNPHITRVGGVLREYGLDELPQLINVLKGEMSLVGPRPVQPWQVQKYDERQRRRLEVKPGITCTSILEGRNKLSWEEKIEYDIEYVENQSLLLDLKILILTPWKVLVTQEGVYGDGEEVDL